jgi:hypothetical protein
MASSLDLKYKIENTKFEYKVGVYLARECVSSDGHGRDGALGKLRSVDPPATRFMCCYACLELIEKRGGM